MKIRDKYYLSFSQDPSVDADFTEKENSKLIGITKRFCLNSHENNYFKECSVCKQELFRACLLCNTKTSKGTLISYLASNHLKSNQHKENLKRVSQSLLKKIEKHGGSLTITCLAKLLEKPIKFPCLMIFTNRKIPKIDEKTVKIILATKCIPENKRKREIDIIKSPILPFKKILIDNRINQPLSNSSNLPIPHISLGSQESLQSEEQNSSSIDVFGDEIFLTIDDLKRI